MAPLVRTGGSRHTGLAALPHRNIQIDYEIGPDESMENVIDTAELLEKIEGEEEVEKMDTLLSLAITGGDESWI